MKIVDLISFVTSGGAAVGGLAGMVAGPDDQKIQWGALAFLGIGFLILLRFIVERHPREMQSLRENVERNADATEANTRAIEGLARSIDGLSTRLPPARSL